MVDLSHYDVPGPKFDIWTWFAAFESVHNQKTDSEEEAVWSHIETAHFVETVTGHHQGNETHTFTQHVDVMDNSIDGKLTVAVMFPFILLLPALAQAEGVVREVRLSSEHIKVVEKTTGAPVVHHRGAAAVSGPES